MAKAVKKASEHLDKVYATLEKEYKQSTIKKRIEALFLDNIGKVVTRDQIVQVAKDPVTGIEPENWHQRLSELRTDDGYEILTNRDRRWLSLQEYVLASEVKRLKASKRIMPNAVTWEEILERARYKCQWSQDGQACGLKNGDLDPIGGGTVKLTADHKTPHSIDPASDPDNPDAWQALCGRHQVMKKNYWDSNTGKMNVTAILQATTAVEKELALKFLLQYFGYKLDKNENIKKDDK